MHLYDVLDGLQDELGGAIRLADCTGRMPWPARGVYFFFEAGEQRTHSGSGPRIVRVGTHALTSTSRSTLWRRLSQHRGSAKTGGGNHRGSVFRLLVGEALMHRDARPLGSWGTGSSAGEAARKLDLERAVLQEREHRVEVAVTEVIGAMSCVWLPCDDAAGAGSMRGVLERGTIALLSNFDKQPLDPPSSAWLGAFSARERVRKSGLWNNNHVDEEYDRSFLTVLSDAVERATRELRSLRERRRDE